MLLARIVASDALAAVQSELPAVPRTPDAQRIVWKHFNFAHVQWPTYTKENQ